MVRVTLGGTRELTVTADVSGQVASMSGQVEIFSGSPVGVSGETVIGKVSGETVVSETSGKLFVGRYYPTPPTVGSGAVTAIMTDSEGKPIVRVSGEAVKVSGEVVSLPVTQVVKVSGEAVKISGEVVDIAVPTTIKTHSVRTISDLSGGNPLHSGAVVSVTVKALSDNSGDLYLGGATALPYSGFGFLLEPGEAINVDVNDFGAIYVCAVVSGDKTTFLGIT